MTGTKSSELTLKCDVVDADTFSEQCPTTQTGSKHGGETCSGREITALRRHPLP